MATQPPGSSLIGYSKDELKQWYQENYPSRSPEDHEPDLRIWQEGLMADDDTFTEVSKICALAAKDGGLLQFVGVLHPDQVQLELAIEQTTYDVITVIESEFPTVPKDWLYAWISSWARISLHDYIESPILEDFGNFREPIKHQVIEYDSRATEGDRLLTPAKGWSPKNIPLYRSTMFLEIAGDDSTDVPYTLGTSSCVFAGRLGESPQDLILELFIDEFQYVLEERGRPIDLRKGVFKLKPPYGAIDALGIIGSNSPTIKNQPGFVYAIEEYLSQKPEPDGRIEFIFIPDNRDTGSLGQRRVAAVPINPKSKQKSVPQGGSTTETRSNPSGAKEQTYEEKIPRLRNMFRPKKLPADEALRQALRSSNGNITESFTLLSEQMRQENLKRPNKVQDKTTSSVPSRAPIQSSSRIPTTNRRRLPNDSAAQRPALANIPSHLQKSSGSQRTGSTATASLPPKGPETHSSTIVSTHTSDTPVSRDHSQPSSFRRVAGQKVTGSDLSINKSKLPAPGSLKESRISIIGPLKRIFGGKQKEEVISPNSTVGGAYDSAFPEVKRLIYRSGGPESGVSEAVLGKFRPAEPEAIDNREVDEKQDGIAQFKELLNRDFLNQLESGVVINSRKTDWESCCRMFQIDPTQNTPHDRVKIAGLHEPLYRFQAFSVFWQMVQSRNAGGGIVADSPGLGKTLTYLALLVVERQLTILWQRVELSRTNKDNLHLPAKGQFVGAVCPNPAGSGWICCPCANEGPTSQLPPIPGVRMALVPASLVGNWRKQWKEHMDLTEKELDMQLLITGNIDNVPQSELADLATNISQLRANKQRRGNDLAIPGQERFMVLATAQTYDPWIAKLRYGGPGTLVETAQNNGKSDRLVWRPGGYKYQIQFGIACADECHEDHHVEQGRARILARLPGNPACWGYSGTPFDHSPRCLEGILYTIEQQAKRFDPLDTVTRWSKVIYYNQFTHEKFDEVCSAFATLVKAKKLNQERLDILLEALIPYLTSFMIRRTQDTRWFGHELVELKPSIHRDIILTHNGAWDSQIKALGPSLQAEGEMRLRALQKDWEKLPRDQRRNYPTSLGFRNMAYSQNRLRILATCPSFVQFTTGPNALSLKNDETRKWYGKGEKLSPYRKNIREIFQNSPKLIWLRQFLIDLDGSTDVNGEEQKVIILTNFYCVALTVKIMIERYIRGKKGRVGMIYAEQALPLKSAAIESFVEDWTEDKKGNEVRKHKYNFQYMVGTPKQLGTGHNLTRSCNVVLMEPDVEFGIETQCYSRVKRAGQKNPVTFTYRLLDSGSEIESQILNEHRKHGGTHGTLIQEETSDMGSPRGPRRGFSGVENEMFIIWALGKHYEGFKNSRPIPTSEPSQEQMNDLINSLAGP